MPHELSAVIALFRIVFSQKKKKRLVRMRHRQYCQIEWVWGDMCPRLFVQKPMLLLSHRAYDGIIFICKYAEPRRRQQLYYMFTFFFFFHYFVVEPASFDIFNLK